jgi:hypothetical protein
MATATPQDGHSCYQYRARLGEHGATKGNRNAAKRESNKNKGSDTTGVSDRGLA